MRQVVKVIAVDQKGNSTGWSFQLERVCCGRPKCGKCKGRSYVHGPYWFAYRQIRGRRRDVYCGRYLPGTGESIGTADAMRAAAKKARVMGRVHKTIRKRLAEKPTPVVDTGRKGR